MKAVILAAGVAMRMRPLTNNTPKCLLKLGGKTILERTIANLLANDINDVVIVTGYLQDQIKNFIDFRFPALKLKYIFNDQFDVTNNIYSLWLAKSEVEGNEFILLDSDIIFDSKIISLLVNSKKENCLALKSVHNLGEEEIKVSLYNDDSIKEISKEVNPAEARGESIGIEKFSGELSSKLFSVLDKMILEENKANVFYEAAFQKLINDGEKIFIEDVGGLKCTELDTADDLIKAEREIFAYRK